MADLIRTTYSPSDSEYGSWASHNLDNFEKVLLDENATCSTSINLLWEQATQLLGHTNGRIEGATIMSSQCGQVVYPAFFESSNFMRKGYLQLCAFPGFLHMDGMRFHSLKDECSNADRKNLAPGLIYPHATLEDEQWYRCPATFVSPRPAYAPDASLCWTISVHDTCLEGRLCLGSFYRAIYEGWKLIQAMCCLLLTTPREHEPDSPAGDLAQHFCLNKTPSKNTARWLLVTVGRDY